MLFSERMKFKEPRSIIQITEIDHVLKTGLWNILYDLIWCKNRSHENTYSLYVEIWRNFFKAPLDLIPNSMEFPGTIRKFIYSDKTLWYEIYDFLEFLVKNISNSDLYDKDILPIAIAIESNKQFEKEMSAYRFINLTITQIITPIEIAEIEECLTFTESFQGVSIHINRALDLLSDRKTPDYRNSIKESISAVESMCKVLTENKKSTLGEGLKKLESFGVTIHPSLKEAFNKLYGYTSDEKGIRHAIFSEESSTFEEAKFMLVSCSAFCNYVIALKK